MSRIIKALFGGYNKVTATASTAAWQYDYGQILKINGLQLPEVYEVHFSNTPEKGVSKTALGNADGVEIPDEYFLSGEPVYAFIYLHDTASDGETEYRIEIPVKPRPRPTHEEPTPVQRGEIEQLIAALNTATEEAEQSAEEAKTSAESAAESAEEARQTAQDLKNSVATVEETKQFLGIES